MKPATAYSICPKCGHMTVHTYSKIKGKVQVQTCFYYDMNSGKYCTFFKEQAAERRAK